MSIVRATEATFTRQVVPLPVIVCFGAQRCPGRRAMTPALEQIAARYAGSVRVMLVNNDHVPLLIEQYGIHASPSMLVFQDGERQSQVIGFFPDDLIDLLAADVAQGLVSGDGFWSPVEARLEDVVLIPLFAQWGWTVQRQAACALGAKQRGRIDLLVFDHADAPPITLVESKRTIGVRTSFSKPWPKRRPMHIAWGCPHSSSLPHRASGCTAATAHRPYACANLPVWKCISRRRSCNGCCSLA
ncbi:thioredoxin family protein [Candidatus Gracilibacteria bacterium]|nr:thioredoxin family protein [Candidatus Gracilibacteria bacterium]